MPSKRPKTAKPKCPWKPPFRIRQMSNYVFDVTDANGHNRVSPLFSGNNPSEMRMAKAICYALNASYPAAKGKRE